MLIFTGILIILQIIYYVFYLHSSFIEGNYKYNIISFISVFLLLALYIKKTSYVLKYGIGYIIQQLLFGFIIFIILLSFFLVVGFFASWGVQSLYFYFTDRRTFLPIDPIFIQVWEYHLVTYQIILFVGNIYVIITEYDDHDLAQKLKKFYLIASIFILVGLALFMYIDLNTVFFYDFFIVAILTYWFFIPLLFLLCDPFKHYYAVMISWLLTTICMWPFIDLIFGLIYLITDGYIWSP